MMKTNIFFISTLVFLFFSESKCIAQYEDSSWLHNELWQYDQSSPIIGRVSLNTFYFTRNGEFYYVAEKSRNTKALNGLLIYNYSGKYTYDPSKREISLYVDRVNNIDSIFVKKIFIDSIFRDHIKISFNKGTESFQWNRTKSENTFVMLSNPALFQLSTMNVDTKNSEYGYFHLKDESNVNDSDQKKILEIIRQAKHVDTINPDREEWVAKSDFILTIGRGEEFASIFIQKGNRQIYVETNGWISGYVRFYEISENNFALLMKIVGEYIQKTN